jgi:hypothetical protein
MTTTENHIGTVACEGLSPDVRQHARSDNLDHTTALRPPSRFKISTIAAMSRSR